MEAVAKLKNCPMSPRKMRLVADLVRGKDVSDAVNILKFTNKKASSFLLKLVDSATNNWEQKTQGRYESDDHDLYISKITVDGGAMLKRFRPAPHGRAHRIRKRTNHVMITVANKKPIDMDTTEEE